MSFDFTDSDTSEKHSEKRSEKCQNKHCKKHYQKHYQKYPDLEGKWQIVERRVRYDFQPDGTIIPPDIYHPEKLISDATIKQNGAFIELDTPSFTGPPRIGVISGKKDDWILRIADTNDNAILFCQIKEICPKKFELVYVESGFACPPPSPNGNPLPCQLDQSPTVSIGQFIRKRV